MRVHYDKIYPRALVCFPGLHIPLVSEISVFDYATVPPGVYLAPLHLHHFHQMDVVLEGDLTVSFKDQPPLHGRPGDAWLIPPLVWHQIESQQGYRQASFKFLLAPRFWPLFGKDFCRFKVSPGLLECLENAGLRSARQRPIAAQQIAAVASLCLVECLDQLAAHPAEEEHLDDFRHQLWPLLERIQREPYEGWTVQQMAAQCNLSLAYFSRSFRRVVRQSPQQYIREARLKAAAAELLSTSGLSLKEIAGHSGYGSVQAFTRAFSAVFKISPAAYLQQATREGE